MHIIREILLKNNTDNENQEQNLKNEAQAVEKFNILSMNADKY